MGSIDVGGSSAQLSYQVELTDKLVDLPVSIHLGEVPRSNNIVTLHKIFGRAGPVQVFSHSFSHFGMYDARNRYDDLITQFHLGSNIKPGKHKIPSPCYLIGAPMEFHKTDTYHVNFKGKQSGEEETVGLQHH